VALGSTTSCGCTRRSPSARWSWGTRRSTTSTPSRASPSTSDRDCGLERRRPLAVGERPSFVLRERYAARARVVLLLREGDFLEVDRRVDDLVAGLEDDRVGVLAALRTRVKKPRCSRRSVCICFLTSFRTFDRAWSSAFICRSNSFSIRRADVSSWFINARTFFVMGCLVDCAMSPPFSAEPRQARLTPSLYSYPPSIEITISHRWGEPLRIRRR
jgi:hypothetical protein